MTKNSRMNGKGIKYPMNLIALRLSAMRSLIMRGTIGN
jgi:hypothetical protein